MSDAGRFFCQGIKSGCNESDRYRIVYDSYQHIYELFDMHLAEVIFVDKTAKVLATELQPLVEELNRLAALLDAR